MVLAVAAVIAAGAGVARRSGGAAAATTATATTGTVRTPASPPQTAAKRVTPAKRVFATAPPQATSITGIEACDAYFSLIERFASCDQLPVAARDGMRSGVEATRDAWRQMNWEELPPDVRHQTSAACTQALDAVRQSAISLDCPL